MSDIEIGTKASEFAPVRSVSPYSDTTKRIVSNPTYEYFEKEEHIRGYLSRQFPTIANPAPLGLCAFALTTFCLSMYNAGAADNLRGAGNQGVVLGMALFYGGLVQLLAGMWEFNTGNTFGAVAFSSYGGFWMGFAALFIKAFGFLDAYTDSVQLNNDLAVFLLSWSIFSAFMTIAAHRTTFTLMFLLFMVHLTFLMLSIHHFCQERWYNIQQTGGAFGLIAAFTAWYAAFGSFLTDKTSLFQLPLGQMDDLYIHWGWLPPKDVK